jgi:outer membrane protein OmpA-like peptidoglycan-associated protein
VERIQRNNPYLEVLEVEIHGHSDNTGSDEYNIGLSQRRARSVSRLITTQLGIDQDLIETRAFGERKPIASNRTRTGRQKNRRVEIFVTVRNLDN